MPKVIDTPDFQNEEDEAAWWDANQARLLAAFQEAERDGTLLTARPPTAAATVQVSSEDAAMAKAQAAQRGLEYDAYVQGILHEAILQQASQNPA